MVAGTDAVAVDAVAAAVMGFDPLRIGYLKYAQDAGLGVATLGGITVKGDPIASVSRRCVPHSNDAIQRHWARLAEIGVTSRVESIVPGPHARPAARAPEKARR